ncbi:MAG TPA: ABC transporter permease [Vicinamibacterales bacterium]|nr:ABC transporter permease [Vicinamibacterales bacterium]
MTRRDLMLRLRTLFRRAAMEHELDEELRFHIECETAKLVARGIAPGDARRQALARFGSRAAVADDCRDERGTGGVETIARDLIYALRTWRRAPLAAVTIVLTVALGLALVTIAFTTYSAFFLRTDAVPHPEEVFELYRPALPGTDAAVPFTERDFESVRRVNTVFRDVATAAGSSEVRIDGRLSTTMFAGGDFFRMAGVSAARGRTLTPADDRAGASPVIVLSDRGWTKLFFRDPAAIGRTAYVNGVAVEIVGVMPEGFRGLAINTPDFFTPVSAAALVRESSAQRAGERPVEIIGRLRAGVSRAEAEAGIRQWAAGPGYQSLDGHPLLATLRPRTGVSPDDTWLEMLAFATPLFFVFGLILLIACANVASLLLARSVARQQELGVRLSLGATRRRLVRQLLTEGLVLGAAASALAYPISRLLAGGVMSVAVNSIPPEFAEQINFTVPEGDWRVLPFLIVGAVTATMMFGLLPALQATRLDPVRTMRGEVLRDARPGRARRTLMVLQVGTSTLLLICSAIFLRGVFVASAADPEVRVSDTVMIGIGTESRRAAVIDALAADPLVSMIGATSGLDEPRIAIRAVETGIVSQQPAQFVSSNEFALLDVPLWRGRAFTNAEDSLDSGVVIVSDRLARTLWPGGEPIGRSLRMAVPPPVHGMAAAAATPPMERTFTVVGMVRDLRGPDFVDAAALYLPAAATSPGMELILRVNEDPLRARTRLLDRLTRVDPALAHVRTLRSVFRGRESILRIAFLCAVVLGGLALLLTASGLFSVLSFLVQQRRKEIGVRMALGASSRAVARLVLFESARPVIMGTAGGVLLAGGTAGALMATPAASNIGQIVQVLDPVAYASALLVIVVACALAASAPALRAARVDPMVTLRSE